MRSISSRPAWAGSDASAHAVMLLAVLIFGVNYVVGRWAVGEVPAYTLGFTRWTVGALVLLPFAWRHILKDRRWVARNWKLVVLAGFLMPFMGAGLTYVALIYTEAINGAVLQTSMPVFIVLLSWVFLRERTAAIQWLGTVLAIAGVLYTVTRGDLSLLLGLRLNLGDAILIACNVGLASYAIAVRLMAPGYHPLTLVTLVCAVGAIIHAPFFAAEMASGETVRASFRGLISLSFVAIFPSVVAILSWNYAIGKLGAARTGFYMYLNPVAAAIVAVPLLGESIGVYHIVGAALIVLGVTLSARKPRPSY